MHKMNIIGVIHKLNTRNEWNVMDELFMAYKLNVMLKHIEMFSMIKINDKISIITMNNVDNKNKLGAS